MDPPVQSLSWITAVLHKARPAQVDHHHDGDDDNGDNDDDDDDNNEDNEGGFNRHIELFNNTFMQSLLQKDPLTSG